MEEFKAPQVGDWDSIPCPNCPKIIEARLGGVWDNFGSQIYQYWQVECPACGGQWPEVFQLIEIDNFQTSTSIQIERQDGTSIKLQGFGIPLAEIRNLPKYLEELVKAKTSPPPKKPLILPRQIIRGWKSREPLTVREVAKISPPQKKSLILPPEFIKGWKSGEPLTVWLPVEPQPLRLGGLWLWGPEGTSLVGWNSTGVLLHGHPLRGYCPWGGKGGEIWVQEVGGSGQTTVTLQAIQLCQFADLTEEATEITCGFSSERSELSAFRGIWNYYFTDYPWESNPWCWGLTLINSTKKL